MGNIFVTIACNAGCEDCGADGKGFLYCWDYDGEESWCCEKCYNKRLAERKAKIAAEDAKREADRLAWYASHS